MFRHWFIPYVCKNYSKISKKLFNNRAKHYNLTSPIEQDINLIKDKKLENYQPDIQQQELAKKKRKRKRLWLLIDLGISLTITTILIVLMLHRPASYNPTKPAKSNEVNKYWTHVILPRVYNSAQEQKPFELTITEEGINQTIADSGWPKISEGAVFSEPQAKFTLDGIMLMGTATIEDVNLIVTIIGKPAIDANGLLHLNLSSVRVGALNVTLVAKIIARKMYKKRLAESDADPDDLNVQVLDSLFDDKPFLPVFDVEDKKIRLTGVTTADGKITLQFTDAGSRKTKR
jgi:hypothetical protein